MKTNLAKVLGLEQHTDERVTFNPSEDDIQQQEVKEFHQYLEDHQQATEVALEAIGSAHAYGEIIQKNNSTDKTTYELLKVAVEQLKEKTGVVTQGTALESLDPVNYKTEGLQDIKKVVVTIWTAIKKAFFTMVDKVKEFIKSLFGKSAKVKESLDEAQEQSKEFSKEAKAAPKTEGDKRDYNEDYFKRHSSNPPPPFSVGKEISQFIGTVNESDFNIKKVSKSIEKFYSDLSDYAHELRMVNLVPLTWRYENTNREFLLGKNSGTPNYDSNFDSSKLSKSVGGFLGPAITFTVSEAAIAEVSINYNDPVRHVQPIDPVEMQEEDDIFYYLTKIHKFSEELAGEMKNMENEMTKFFKEQEKHYNGINTDDESARAKIEQIKKNNNQFLQLSKGVLMLKSRVVTYAYEFVKAFSNYIKANIAYYKAHMATDLNNKGYVTPMDYEEYHKQNA